MAVFNCLGDNKARIISAEDAEEAAAKCMERYGYFPESVIKLEKEEPK